MKHFAHFVKRGARYVKMNGEFSSCCVAFENPNGEKVVVIMNPYKTEKTVEIEGKSYALPAESINTITIE
jgi:glucosylceramidase